MSKQTAHQILRRLRKLTQGRFVLDSCGIWSCELQTAFVQGSVAMIIVDVGDEQSHVKYVPIDKLEWWFKLYSNE